MEPTVNPSTPVQPVVTQSPPPAPVIPPQNFQGGASTTQDSGVYPVQVTVEFPAEQSRILALFSLPYFFIRFVLLIPQFIALYVIIVLASFAAWFNQFSILFTGHGSEGLHNFVVGSLRWSARVSAYSLGVTDKYPPFSLK